jgi:hypothetical protein
MNRISLTEETPFVAFWAALNAHLKGEGKPELLYGPAMTVWKATRLDAEKYACDPPTTLDKYRQSLGAKSVRIEPERGPPKPAFRVAQKAGGVGGDWTAWIEGEDGGIYRGATAAGALATLFDSKPAACAEAYLDAYIRK